jgi:hypothetical protein
MTERIVDGLGNEVGRIWLLRGESVGLLDGGYQALKNIAKALERTLSLRTRVEIGFLVDEIFCWLQTALEQGPGAKPPMTPVSKYCEKEIQEDEVWVPLFRVHGRQQFSIGEVIFRNISSTMMERFFDETGKPPLTDAARHVLQRQRSQLQDHLAACVRQTAEKKTAQAIARLKAEEAIALLRFLSPANWVLGMQSYCLALGRGRIEIPTELQGYSTVWMRFTGTTLRFKEAVM